MSVPLLMFMFAQHSDGFYNAAIGALGESSPLVMVFVIRGARILRRQPSLQEGGTTHRRLIRDRVKRRTPRILPASSVFMERMKRRCVFRRREHDFPSCFLNRSVNASGEAPPRSRHGTVHVPSVATAGSMTRRRSGWHAFAKRREPSTMRDRIDDVAAQRVEERRVAGRHRGAPGIRGRAIVSA
jgi:hypothetical protein